MEVGSFVRILETDEIAEVVEVKRNRLVVVIDEQEQKSLSIKDVEYIEPVNLTEADLRNIFRLNVAYMDMYDDIRLAPNYRYEKPYLPDIDDLLAMVANFKIQQVTVGQFLSALFEINIILKPCYLPKGKASENDLERCLFAKEEDIFQYVFELFDVNELDGDEVIGDHFDLDDIIRMISLFKRDKEKPIEQREYVDTIKENFVLTIQDNDLIDTIEKPYDELFVRFVKQLAEKDNQIGLEVLGYCYYGGNRLFDCDWVKCKDIFEKLYSRYGDPSIANSLGYIYYYGRTSGGNSDYKKAFEYFSIGAAAGIYESKYKLADLFRHGYYVSKNPKVAEDIYYDLYQENLKIFSKGFFDCKLADIALRLGGVYSERKEFSASYYFYLQAELAIRKRMTNFNYYGDRRVFDGVIAGLEQCRRNQHFETVKHADMTNLDILKMFFEDHHRIEFKIRPLKGNKLKIIAKRLAHRNEYTPLCLLTMLSFNGCLLTDELTITALDVDYHNLPECFIATDIEYDRNMIYFYDQQQEVGCLDCYGFRINNPIKKDDKEEYRFVSVKVDQKSYDFLCDDIYVVAGDSVYVSIEGKPKKGIVTNSFVRDVSDLPKSIEDYQPIIRKTEE